LTASLIHRYLAALAFRIVALKPSVGEGFLTDRAAQKSGANFRFPPTADLKHPDRGTSTFRDLDIQ
jgi:hypothetical protein